MFGSSKFLLVLFAICLLAGAPALVWAESKGAEAKPKAEGEGGGEEGGKKKKGGFEVITGGKFAGDPVYVHLQPVILPIISDAGAEQIITMLIDLETKDFETASKMHANMPRLKDAIIQALYGGLADGSMRNANALDIAKIKQNILNLTNRVFGEGSVHDVLIQAVAQRKL